MCTIPMTYGTRCMFAGSATRLRLRCCTSSTCLAHGGTKYGVSRQRTVGLSCVGIAISPSLLLWVTIHADDGARKVDTAQAECQVPTGVRQLAVGSWQRASMYLAPKACAYCWKPERLKHSVCGAAACQDNGCNTTLQRQSCKLLAFDKW